MHTHINRAGWLVAGVLALFVVAAMTGIVSGGPLDPPGAPSATGTLPQVEPRSPIPPVGWNGAFPIVIDQPGSYFFTRSLTGVGFNAGIEISADNVSLDLNGFALTGPGGAVGSGILVQGQREGLHISNGVVRNWDAGINGWWAGGEAVYSRVDHITAIDNSFSGIVVGFDSEIIDCNASGNLYGDLYTLQRRARLPCDGQFWLRDLRRGRLACRRQQGVEQRLRDRGQLLGRPAWKQHGKVEYVY